VIKRPIGALREAQLEERSAFAELEERTRFPGALGAAIGLEEKAKPFA
jgi:hypothetical protein